MAPTELVYTEIEKLVTNLKNIPASQPEGVNKMQARFGLVHEVRLNSKQ